MKYLETVVDGVIHFTYAPDLRDYHLMLECLADKFCGDDNHPHHIVDILNKDEFEHYLMLLGLTHMGTLLEIKPPQTLSAERVRAIEICMDMSNRYDEDIEGCDADELSRYNEAIDCCYRLAYRIKYGHMPSSDMDAWMTEFSVIARKLSPDWKETE